MLNKSVTNELGSLRGGCSGRNKIKIKTNWESVSEKVRSDIFLEG